MKIENIIEAIGANSMERDTADLIVSPDIKSASSLAFHQGSAGSIPTHWNNSPFLSGGRLTSAFGANPKSYKKSKFKIKNYKEYLKSRKTNESSIIPMFSEFIK